MEETNNIKIFLADDHKILRESLELLLSQQPNYALQNLHLIPTYPCMTMQITQSNYEKTKLILVVKVLQGAYPFLRFAMSLEN